MSDKRYLVLDVETVPDYELVRQVFGLGANATLEELRQRIREKYSSGIAPPPFHIPVCIALIDVDSDHFKVQNAIVLENPEEKGLLEAFWRVSNCRKGKEIRTTLVHFNGRAFDLPVLFLRSMKHRIRIVTWDRNRYSFENSHDICDDLAEFGATGRTSLNIISKMLGLPGKTDIQGSHVEELYFRGERTRIKDYCMQDALSTYLVWLTIRFVRGEIPEEKYREAFHSAPEMVTECRSKTESSGAWKDQDSPE